jgi:sarcosine oxidase subunit gamma
MLEVLQRTAESGARPPAASSAPVTRSLLAGWREGLSVVNLRGNAEDPAFCEGVARALGGAALPTKAATTSESGIVRIVWAGPDDWFVIGPKGHAEEVAERLRDALAGLHHAVTDVSSGYTVLHLSGTPARDVLAQGCPLDLHPRAFASSACAGSHFFKASVWLWQTDEAPVYELLVRRSFMGYVWLMLERTTIECGLITRRFA